MEPIVQLRPYQNRDFNDIEEAFKEVNGVLYQLPTGGGKSVIVSSIVHKHKEEPTIILAHKRRLITQMKEHLARVGITAGVMMGDIAENLDADILIASINTASRDKRMEVLLNRTNKFKRIIIDEAHRTRTPSYEKLLDPFLEADPTIKLLGVTATPYRVDKKGLDKYYQTLICSDDVATLQQQGYLAKYKVFYTPVGEIDKEVTKTESDYVVTALSTYMRNEKFLQYLVDSYKREAEGLQTIIFCVDKAHAKSVMEKYISSGYNKIAYIDSDTKEEERERIFKEYEEKTIQFIVCIETLTEGVDLPETGCIQLARPTKSLVLYLQMVGRGLRPKQDGSDLIILDCGGCTVEHGTPASPKHWSLNPEIHPNNPRKKNKIVGKRLDGTFTENKEEMEFLELVEMEPEDYLVNISGNIEEAEQTNKDIEKSAKDLLREFGNEVLKKIKVNDHKAFVFESEIRFIYEKDIIAIQENKKKKEENPDNYWDKVRYYFPTLSPATNYTYSRRNQKAQMVGVKLSYSNENGRWSDEQITDDERVQKMRCLSLQGKLAEHFMVKENYKHLTEVFEEANSIIESKIDIEALKLTVEKFKDEQLMKRLAENLILSTEVILTESIHLSSFFPNAFPSYGYGRRSSYSNYETKKLVFSKNKLLSTNEIEFFNESGQSLHVAKFVEKPKLLDMLKRGKYLEPKEDVSVNQSN